MKKIIQTDACNEAKWMYTGMKSQEKFPLLSALLTEKEKIEYLKEILSICPEYYPVFNELGGMYIKKGMDKTAKKYFNKTFNEVYLGILEFYRLLSDNKLVLGYKELKKEMLKLKPELIEKMKRYNEVRHNDDYSEEQKEEIRYELFERDHSWSFL
ncbi:hypothetical protein GF327_08485 [Candidatus Woesearchaeota archaeon]|nr:hypothetical protein [Candidatus Woesearchaeota archaeon]